MKIRIHGTPQNTSRRDVCRFVRFCASALMNPALIEGITIHIHFGRTHGFRASAEWMDRPERPKRFRFVIRETMSRQELLECVAHEMVHVKQYATGQLREYVSDPGFLRWEQHRWVSDADEEMVNKDDEDYWLAPWEIEAR